MNTKKSPLPVLIIAAFTAAALIVPPVLCYMLAGNIGEGETLEYIRALLLRSALGGGIIVIPGLLWLLAALKDRAKRINVLEDSIKGFAEEKENREQELEKFKSAAQEGEAALLELRDIRESEKIHLSNYRERISFLEAQWAGLKDTLEQCSTKLADMEQTAEAAFSAALLPEERAVPEQTAVHETFMETGALMKGLAKSAENMEELQQTLSEGETQAEETNKIIISIALEVEKITGLVEGISHISAQTNILSMNAAIESAHAGSAGAGFAVVADEIKKLAESTAKNTKEIQIQIKAIAEQTRAGLRAGNRSVQTIGGIRETMTETGSLLSRLAEQLSGLQAGAVPPEAFPVPENPQPSPGEYAEKENPAAGGQSKERRRIEEDLRTQQEQLRRALDNIKIRIPGSSGAPEIPPAASTPVVTAAPSTAPADTKNLDDDTLDSKGVAVKEEPRIIP
jgi:DNA repair exonuclease SbcCD ATPase subunit